MSTLEELIQSGSPATPIQFRATAYGVDGEREFLRDLMAMANANVKGPRLIVIGVDVGGRGAERVPGVDATDFERQPSYVELARQHIEPPIPVSYRSIAQGDSQVGIFQIGDCQDRPYMMGRDHSAGLRRGDAWVRVNNEVFRLGRGQLQALFQSNFKESIGAERVEIGFAGEMSQQRIVLPVCDLDQLPSLVAASKIREVLAVKQNSAGSGNTSMMERLTHARVYGSNDPYQEHSTQTLIGELDEITRRHRVDDQNFLFQANGCELQLRIFNQSDSSIEDASITIKLPNLEELYVADNPGDEGYPAVNIKDDSILVTEHLGEIPPGVPVSAFKTSIKLCAGRSLEGQRFSVGYTLFGRNLRSPVTGHLAIDFRDQLEALMA
jgi:hypothetical protein